MFTLEESLVDDCCWEDWFLVSIIAILYTSGLRIETTIFFNVYFILFSQIKVFFFVCA